MSRRSKSPVEVRRRKMWAQYVLLAVLSAVTLVLVVLAMGK